MTESPPPPGPFARTAGPANDASTAEIDPLRRATPSARHEVDADGQLTVSQTVVQKIAATAAREVVGVHSLGTGTARSLVPMRDRIPGSAPSTTAGVAVEVGQTQTAIDLDLVVEYGTPITEIARAVRRHVITAVEQLTGLQVVEVNITVDDVNLPTAANGDGTRLQ